jgi:proline dehydrogenase
MSEDEIYVYTKEWLKDKGYIILGGQPPNGSDDFPVVEIKKEKDQDKGSKGSFKPDLVAKNSQEILVIECKPKYDKDDEEKLKQVLINKKRQQLLIEELSQRKLINESEKDLKIKFCLANNSNIAPLESLNNIFINDYFEKCLVIRPKKVELGIS